MGVDSASSGRKCLRTGLWGSVIAAICCFTPVLVVALGLAGMAAVIPYLDMVLFPLLGLFLMLAAYGWVSMRKSRRQPG
jgi:mercuric ion transport protein